MNAPVPPYKAYELTQVNGGSELDVLGSAPFSQNYEKPLSTAKHAQTGMPLIAALKDAGITVITSPHGDKSVMCSIDKLAQFIVGLEETQNAAENT